jgi:hypothetical protein
MSDLVPVPVPGADDLMAAQFDGREWAALKPMCDTLGIDHATQLRKLQRRSWAVVGQKPMTAADGKTYQTTVVDSETIPMWLATIDENRVAEDARPKLIAYQREARAALHSYFNQRTAAPALNQLDVLRAALDQIEATQRDAAEAKAIAQRAEARLDGIEGRHDWFSALGYAKTRGLPTYQKFLARVGKHAAMIARSHGIEPDKTQHPHFGYVNSFPVWVWDLAAEGFDA